MNKKSFKLFPILILSILFISCGIKDSNTAISTDKNLIIEEKDKEIIRTYLNEKTGNDFVESNGKCYSVFEVLGTGENEIYLWVYKENESGSASAMPVLLDATKENNLLNIISYKVPGECAFYDKDIRKMFPKEIQNKIFNVEDKQLD